MDRLLHLEQDDSVRWSLDLAKIFSISWDLAESTEGGPAWIARIYTTEKENNTFSITFTPEGKDKLIAAWDELVQQRNPIFSWTYTTEIDDEGHSCTFEEIQIDLGRISAVQWRVSTMPGMDWVCEIYTYDNYEPLCSIECLEGEKDEFQQAYHHYGLTR